jgi:predicted DNA-binding transcriptional regulator AlpA
MKKNGSKPSHTPTNLGRLLGYQDLQEIFGLSRRTIERDIAKGIFPKPMKIGGVARWREETVRSYLDRLEGQAR